MLESFRFQTRGTGLSLSHLEGEALNVRGFVLMFWNAKRGWEAYLGHFVSWKNKKLWIPQWAPWIHKKYAQMMFFQKYFFIFLCVNVYSYVTNLISCLILLNALPFSRYYVVIYVNIWSYIMQAWVKHVVKQCMW